ncbi:MFS transporter [Sinorhizobium meliloti]|uniref:MFS transporter n=1 Tax=Rhizobium meliloti TaxID=382 RepID=UPI003D654473
MAHPLPEKNAGGSNGLDWRLLLPVFVITGLYAAGIGAVLPVLPFHLREMGANPFVFGIVLATEALSQFAAAPLLGQLSDRFGRRNVLLASQALAVTSLLLLALAQNILIVLLARFLFGPTAGNFSAAAAYAADNSSPTARRRAIGIVSAGGGLGAIVGAVLSSILSDVSLTAPIYLALGMSAIGIAVTFFGMKDGPAAGSRVIETDREQHSLRAIGSSPVIRVLAAVMLCHFLAYGMYTSQLPMFLGERFTWNGHAFGTRELSYLIAADGMINIFVQLLLLRWLDRFFSERGMIVLIFALVGYGFSLCGIGEYNSRSCLCSVVRQHGRCSCKTHLHRGALQPCSFGPTRSGHRNRTGARCYDGYCFTGLDWNHSRLGLLRSMDRRSGCNCTGGCGCRSDASSAPCTMVSNGQPVRRLMIVENPQASAERGRTRAGQHWLSAGA